MPVAVTIASPRTGRAESVPPTASATFFRGTPANRGANSADQSTTKPQFAGCRGAASTPARSSGSTHAPFEPDRGPPPCARRPRPRPTGPAEGQHGRVAPMDLTVPIGVDPSEVVIGPSLP